ncbi:MAG: hypothetical protein ACR2G3_04255 [Solirubrobacterales bacterium]
MRLRLTSLLLLFGIGAACGLVGDHAAVASGVERYLDTGGAPFIWDSPFFFALSVGLATAATAELRLHLAPPRPGDAWEGLAAVASVLAIYLLTSILADEPTGAATALIACLAALVLVRFGDGRPAIICGALVAVAGPLVEIVEAEAGIFEYAENVDGLLGVGPWLVPLYFAYGVVCARLGELLAPADE